MPTTCCPPTIISGMVTSTAHPAPPVLFHTSSIPSSLAHIERIPQDIRYPLTASLAHADQVSLLRTSREMYDAVVPHIYERIKLELPAAELFIEGLPASETQDAAGGPEGGKDSKGWGSERKLAALALTRYLSLEDVPAVSIVFPPPAPPGSPPPIRLFPVVNRLHIGQDLLAHLVPGSDARHHSRAAWRSRSRPTCRQPMYAWQA
ncbi:hypothetical protein IAT38_003002 [Cryptococcus sp. DSM 104549]